MAKHKTAPGKLPAGIAPKLKELKSKAVNLQAEEWKDVLKATMLIGLTWREKEDIIGSSRTTILTALKAHGIESDIRAKFFSFMRGHSVGELAEKFALDQEIVSAVLKDPPSNSHIYADTTLPGKERIFCLANGGEAKLHERKFVYVKAEQGASAIDVVFNNDVIPKDAKSKDAKNAESGEEKIRIVPLSDIWFGSPSHEGAVFDECISWIARERHVFWFFNGDAILPPKAKDLKEGKLNDLVAELRAKLAPIAHKCLWAQAGCFERKLRETADAFDPMEYLCSEWGIPYFQDPLSAGVHFSGKLFKFYCIHGHSLAQKKGSKLNALTGILPSVEFCNYTVMSHVGDAMSLKRVRVTQDIEAFDLVERKQYLFTTPSFKRYDGSREAQRGHGIPFKGQINAAIFKNGDYHLYVSSAGSNFVRITTEE